MQYLEVVVKIYCLTQANTDTYLLLSWCYSFDSFPFFLLLQIAHIYVSFFSSFLISYTFYPIDISIISNVSIILILKLCVPLHFHRLVVLLECHHRMKKVISQYFFHQRVVNPNLDVIHHYLQSSKPSMFLLRERKTVGKFPPNIYLFPVTNSTHPLVVMKKLVFTSAITSHFLFFSTLDFKNWGLSTLKSSSNLRLNQATLHLISLSLMTPMSTI